MHQDNVRPWPKRLLPVLLSLVLVACAASPDVDELGLAQPLAYEAVTVLEGEPDGSFSELGRVRGSICYRSTFDFELKSRDAAIRDMRRQAAELGADTIIRLDCQSRRKRDWLSNCLATLSCSGLAVRTDPAQ